MTMGPSKKNIAKSLESGVCMLCHDSPTKHSLGKFYKESAHYKMPAAGLTLRVVQAAIRVIAVLHT